MNTKVLLGMSGGVDSSVAALLLKEQGYDVTGLTLILTENDDGTNARDAAEVAKSCGISHCTLDLRDTFRSRVTEAFVRDYRKGVTPNPCIVCNKTIKFGAMLDYAKANGFRYVATGHYAQIAENKENGRLYLKRAECIAKDQTYFLYTLTQQQLSAILFPLGTYTKDEVRQYAQKRELCVAKKHDSQDICFIPDGDKNKYLSKYLEDTPGNFLDTQGNVIGKHKGVFRYTYGQRKGLGAFGKPMFVLSIDGEKNEIVLGDGASPFGRGFIVEHVNFMKFERPAFPLHCLCKVRYSAQPEPCVVTETSEGLCVMMEQPARAVTPGQAAVFYDEDGLVGGGTILRPVASE